MGSSMACSSPTSASAIARRIPGVGVVRVSLYRSIMPGTSSASATRALVATGSLRSHTAVSWNTAPPFGAASALIRALIPMPSSNAAFGQMLSTTSTPGCWPSRTWACRRTAPRPLPSRTGSPAAMPSRLASSGWIRTVGRASLRIEVGVSVKLVLR